MRFLTGRAPLDGISTAHRDAWESVHGQAPGHAFDPCHPLTAVDEPDLDRGRRIDHYGVFADLLVPDVGD